MAKDPAVLWYWNDWNGGTITLSRYAKGCYMDLLHAQFNNGHLSDAEVRTVLGQDYGQYWPLLSKKFSKDSNGNYYNCRLDEEITRRKNFSLKQSENGKKGGRPKTKNNPTLNPTLKPNISLLESETETETEIQDRGVQGGKESLEDFIRDAFDEITIGNIKSTFPRHDVGNELLIFQLKVRAAPNDYKDHKVEGLRKAFISQLSKSTSTNGHRKGTKTDIRRADATVSPGEDFGKL
jgi:uncharacterized protein YdaU (DUF1376 family)